MRYLCLETRQLYITVHYTNENTTDYLDIFWNSQKVNEECNGSIILRVVQEHVMKILYSFHVTSFDTLLDNGRKEVETAG